MCIYIYYIIYIGSIYILYIYIYYILDIYTLYIICLCVCIYIYRYRYRIWNDNIMAIHSFCIANKRTATTPALGVHWPWSLALSLWPPPALELHGCEATSWRPWSSANSSPSLRMFFLKDFHQRVGGLPVKMRMLTNQNVGCKHYKVSEIWPFRWTRDGTQLTKMAKNWDNPWLRQKRKGRRCTVASQVSSNGSLVVQA